MLNPEGQSARMSKITNEGLTRSGTGFTQIATVGVKGLTLLVPPLSHPTPPLEPPQLEKCRTATGRLHWTNVYVARPAAAAAQRESQAVNTAVARWKMGRQSQVSADGC